MIAAGSLALAAAADPAGGSGVRGLLVTLVAIIVGTKVLGEITQRLGQPAVLGELIAGVLLGGSVLGLVDPSDPALHALSEIGVLVLLFAIGLETNLRAFAAVGSAAVTVALVGVALPFGLGYGALSLLGVGPVAALVCAAALTATSIGISARVLSDLDVLDTPEGRVTLGAAVLDDIVGLVILAVVAGVVAGGAPTVLGVVRTSGVAVGFVAFALLAGSVAIPPLFRFLEQVRVAGALGLFALAFAFALAWAADAAGSAMIVGAFAAGVVLHPTPQRAQIEEATTRLGHFFVPIFFASVGAALDLRALATPRALLVGLVLVVTGAVGKVAAGFAPAWFRGNKLLVGVAMIPRGEVGLIFARVGLATGALTQDLFGAVMLMVLVTTFVTPPLLERAAHRNALRVESDDVPGDGGIDDLVCGTSESDGAQARRARTTPAVGAAEPGA